MSTTKNATIRYLTLDRCLRNPGKRYNILDLVEACNEALFEINPKSSGVQKRQVYEDLKFMKDSKGYSAPIESYRDGKKCYHRYEDKNFSISNQPLNEEEAQLLKESMMTLNRFKGLPQFNWIEELTARLEHNFKLKSNEKVISFDDNEYLTGREHIQTLYNSIINKQTLSITYHPYFGEDIHYDFHPYHLKQYNKRWFALGKDTNLENITNLALDRILTIMDSDTNYIENNTINFDEHFEDVIGVTIPNKSKPENILLKINSQLWPYIKTKPLHGSQRIIQEETDYVIIQLEVYINYELQALILSRGEQIEVLDPEHFREHLKARIKKLNSQYL